MNEITEMNVANAKAVRKLIDNQLPNLLSEHGLTFELGNAVYDNDSIKFNGFRISIKGGLSQEEKALNEELKYRNRWKREVSLDQTKIADLNGKKVSLVGYKPRARKNPFIVQDLTTSKKYIINEQTANKLFGKILEESDNEWFKLWSV